ncbi:hypothetical protein O988_08505 [Pseudogymnoascus sp. VKM F-3808]|nr:hypothetical protein O988_08505 [Pseudogymnoascus sp. VKM F-3808]
MTPSLPEWLTEATEASKGQEEKHVNASRPAWPGRLVASSLPTCRHTPPPDPGAALPAVGESEGRNGEGKGIIEAGKPWPGSARGCAEVQG